jgi:hypothetical protein
MKKIALLISIIFLVSMGCAANKKPAFTKHFPDSLFKITEKEKFSIEIVTKGGGFKKGINPFEIIIHNNRDEDVERAEIDITPWMPGAGHGSDMRPVVFEKSGGLYMVEDLSLQTVGHWQLKIRVKKGAADDSATFDLPDIK